MACTARIKNPSGSILVEALLAVVILSVGLSLIIQSMVSSLRASSVSSDYTMAVLLIENEMFEYLQKGYLESGYQREDQLGKPFDKFRFKASASSLDDLPDVQLTELDGALSWNLARRKNEVTVSTLLFPPPNETN